MKLPTGCYLGAGFNTVDDFHVPIVAATQFYRAGVKAIWGAYEYPKVCLQQSAQRAQGPLRQLDRSGGDRNVYEQAWTPGAVGVGQGDADSSCTVCSPSRLLT